MMKLCLSPNRMSLRTDIDFPPEVKIVLAQNYFFSGWTGVKKCESLFCSMLFLALKKKQQKTTQKWQRDTAINMF